MQKNWRRNFEINLNSEKIKKERNKKKCHCLFLMFLFCFVVTRKTSKCLFSSPDCLECIHLVIIYLFIALHSDKKKQKYMVNNSAKSSKTNIRNCTEVNVAHECCLAFLRDYAVWFIVIHVVWFKSGSFLLLEPWTPDPGAT